MKIEIHQKLGVKRQFIFNAYCLDAVDSLKEFCEYINKSQSLWGIDIMVLNFRTKGISLIFDYFGGEEKLLKPQRLIKELKRIYNEYSKQIQL